MALIFMDGFDHYNTPAQKGWIATGGNMQASGTRFGSGQCYSLGGNQNMYQQLPSTSEHATIIIGCAVYRSANVGVHNDWLFYSDAHATTHVVVAIMPDGSIGAWRGGYNNANVLGISAANNLVPPNVWAYIEIKVTLSDTVGVVEVRLNGSATPVLNVSGVDTKNGGTKTTIDSVGINNSTGTSLYDDVYILNPSGSVNTTFLGDVRVETIYPTGAGASTGLTPSTGANWAAVDETPPNTTDYVSSAGTNVKDTYAMGDLSTGASTVVGMQIGTYAMKTDTGVKQYRQVVRSGGTDYPGTARSPATSYNYDFAISETNPATSVAWTKSTVNAVEIGVEVL
jgi:hypothetical protein